MRNLLLTLLLIASMASVLLLSGCDDDKCDACSGTGYYDAVNCPMCDGTGHSDFDWDDVPIY